MGRSVRKNYTRECLEYMDDDVLFDVLRRSSVEEMEDATFKDLLRECLIRMFYNNTDYFNSKEL